MFYDFLKTYFCLVLFATFFSCSGLSDWIPDPDGEDDELFERDLVPYQTTTVVLDCSYPRFIAVDHFFKIDQLSVLTTEGVELVLPADSDVFQRRLKSDRYWLQDLETPEGQKNFLRTDLNFYLKLNSGDTLAIDLGDIRKHLENPGTRKITTRLLRIDSDNRIDPDDIIRWMTDQYPEEEICGGIIEDCHVEFEGEVVPVVALEKGGESLMLELTLNSLDFTYRNGTWNPLYNGSKVQIVLLRSEQDILLSSASYVITRIYNVDGNHCPPDYVNGNPQSQYSTQCEKGVFTFDGESRVANEWMDSTSTSLQEKYCAVLEPDVVRLVPFSD